MAKEVRQASRIYLDDFTEVVTASLLRAAGTRKRPFGPILIGIIWWPEGTDFGQFGKQVVGPGAGIMPRRQ